MYLLNEIFEAHGGLDLWQSIYSISLKLRFHGLAFASKFNRSGLLERNVQVFRRQCKVIFSDYPKKGYTGFFEHDSVSIEDPKGAKIIERTNCRDSFSSLQKTIYWTDTDLLYFAGYALWNYINAPFLLGYEGVTIKSFNEWTEKGETLYRLTAEFSDLIPTHCKQQSYYFNKELLLVRHDYNPEIFSPYAKAAHYSWAHNNVDGIKIPFKRKVVPRMNNGTTKSWPKLVWIHISNAHINSQQNQMYN